MSKCRDIIRLVYYPLKRMFDYGEYKRFIKESAIQVRDTNETIRYILANQVSVSRFGDGEYMVMNQSGNGFQCPDKKLGERLKEVLINPEKPDVPLNKNDAFQKVQKRRVQEKR